MRILYTYFVSKAKKFLLSSIDVGFLNSNCRNYVKNFLEFNHLVSNNANNATEKRQLLGTGYSQLLSLFGDFYLGISK